MKNNEISGIKINDLKVIFNFNSMSNIYFNGFKCYFVRIYFNDKLTKNITK